MRRLLALHGFVLRFLHCAAYGIFGHRQMGLALNGRTVWLACSCGREFYRCADELSVAASLLRDMPPDNWAELGDTGTTRYVVEREKP